MAVRPLPEGVRLVNGEDRAARSARFHIPSRAERESLKVGDIAKVAFEYRIPGAGYEGERMWAIVIEVRDGFLPRYRATLNNVPVLVPMDYDDELEFGPEHVIDIAPRASLI